ncbi:hypothetical protein Q7C36_010386 [Tachysurus vachellii]|uniref:Chemokine interleukin-8-like domain-containing protein n=1 Tax=Tachysurus vachellii TaxID=175792 RepID=A0AA88MUM7_TACVA|nr:interleukin-8 [Tachysurus vachellii]KAK2845532.1 hypothetical protein Q7C36_010386 [Tachysurus vachellii]
MPLRAHCSLLLAVIALCCFATVFAFPMDGFAPDNQCRCLHTTNERLNVRMFQRIEIVPAGPNCRNTEVIITMKQKRVVCVDPDADWVQRFIAKVVKRNGTMN